MVPSANKKSSPEIVPSSFSNAPPARTNTAADEQRESQGQQQQPAGLYALPSNDEILAAVAAAAAQNNQQQLQSDPTALEESVASSTMRKRGINYEYNPYGVSAGSGSSDYGVELPSGIWTEDYEPAQAAPLNYNNYNNYNNNNNERDLQELDDYVPERHGKSTAVLSLSLLSNCAPLFPPAQLTPPMAATRHTTTCRIYSTPKLIWKAFPSRCRSPMPIATTTWTSATSAAVSTTIWPTMPASTAPCPPRILT